ncbi:MAG TPA: MaoC family dehydratase N-terminal domain-containing protein, partial [Acidimicrobiales bacterium]|nr:MaoC family dehydratase N-terminal domain-containing protein [Acidimicrobiales bacterium]
MSAVPVDQTATKPPTPPSEFDQQLAAFAGQSTDGTIDAPDEVNQAMIRHWVEAMGDTNPVYVDEAA